MYCRKCGAQNEEGARFCHNCGEKLEEQNTQYADVYTAPQDNYDRNVYTQPVPGQNPACSKLGWHKFLVNFALIASAVILILQGISLISGFAYGEDRDYILANFTAAVWADRIAGILNIGLAVYVFDTRTRLAKFRAGAPKRLIMIYVLNVVLAIVNTLMIALTIGAEFIAVETIVGAVLNAVLWIIINNSYYKKRAQLFVN